MKFVYCFVLIAICSIMFKCSGPKVPEGYTEIEIGVCSRVGTESTPNSVYGVYKCNEGIILMRPENPVKGSVS